MVILPIKYVKPNHQILSAFKIQQQHRLYIFQLQAQKRSEFSQLFTQSDQSKFGLNYLLRRTFQINQSKREIKILPSQNPINIIRYTEQAMDNSPYLRRERKSESIKGFKKCMDQLQELSQLNRENSEWKKALLMDVKELDLVALGQGKACQILQAISNSFYKIKKPLSFAVWRNISIFLQILCMQIEVCLRMPKQKQISLKSFSQYISNPNAFTKLNANELFIYKLVNIMISFFKVSIFWDQNQIKSQIQYFLMDIDQFSRYQRTGIYILFGFFAKEKKINFKYVRNVVNYLEDDVFGSDKMVQFYAVQVLTAYMKKYRSQLQQQYRDKFIHPISGSLGNESIKERCQWLRLFNSAFKDYPECKQIEVMDMLLPLIHQVFEDCSTVNMKKESIEALHILSKMHKVMTQDRIKETLSFYEAIFNWLKQRKLKNTLNRACEYLVQFVNSINGSWCYCVRKNIEFFYDALLQNINDIKNRTFVACWMSLSPIGLKYRHWRHIYKKFERIINQEIDLGEEQTIQIKTIYEAVYITAQVYRQQFQEFVVGAMKILVSCLKQLIKKQDEAYLCSEFHGKQFEFSNLSEKNKRQWLRYVSQMLDQQLSYIIPKSITESQIQNKHSYTLKIFNHLLSPFKHEHQNKQIKSIGQKLLNFLKQLTVLKNKQREPEDNGDVSILTCEEDQVQWVVAEGEIFVAISMVDRLRKEVAQILYTIRLSAPPMNNLLEWIKTQLQRSTDTWSINQAILYLKIHLKNSPKTIHKNLQYFLKTLYNNCNSPSSEVRGNIADAVGLLSELEAKEVKEGYEDFVENLVVIVKRCYSKSRHFLENQGVYEGCLGKCVDCFGRILGNCGKVGKVQYLVDYWLEQVQFVSNNPKQQKSHIQSIITHIILNPSSSSSSSSQSPSKPNPSLSAHRIVSILKIFHKFQKQMQQKIWHSECQIAKLRMRKAVELMQGWDVFRENQREIWEYLGEEERRMCWKGGKLREGKKEDKKEQEKYQKDFYF